MQERRPPRFVPTLTEVVAVPEPLSPPAPAVELRPQPEAQPVAAGPEVGGSTALPQAVPPPEPVEVIGGAGEAEAGAAPAAVPAAAPVVVAPDSGAQRQDAEALLATMIPTLLDEYLPDPSPSYAMPELDFPDTASAVRTPADLDDWTLPGDGRQSAMPAGATLDHAAWMDAITARVMQRVDAVLQERLRYALADIVQIHTDALYQSLRASVQDMVHASVTEAVVQELAAQERLAAETTPR